MDGVFEAAALVMRFWFFAVAFVVLLGAAGISINEYREKRFVLGVAQSSIGYLHIISGPEDMMGENVQLMYENTVGRSRRVNIIFRDASVDKAHSQIYQGDDGRVYVNRLGRGDVSVNGTHVHDTMAVYNDDVICFGNVVTRLHVKEV
ncbi:MAG: FHA domain-containing protein [Eubacteriales bacterium]|nr:FHA domain-containing protein [Eubacteriales bacterium]